MNMAYTNDKTKFRIPLDGTEDTLRSIAKILFESGHVYSAKKRYKTYEDWCIGCALLRTPDCVRTTVRDSNYVVLNYCDCKMVFSLANINKNISVSGQFIYLPTEYKNPDSTRFNFSEFITISLEDYLRFMGYKK